MFILKLLVNLIIDVAFLILRKKDAPTIPNLHYIPIPKTIKDEDGFLMGHHM